MARSCFELLEPSRYGGDRSNFLLAQSLLAFSGGPPDESFRVACGLIDLSRTSQGAAALASQEVALMEGRTSRHELSVPEVLAQAHQLAAEADALSFDCAVTFPQGKIPASLLSSHGRLPGAWIAVTDDPLQVPAGMFDLVVSSKNVLSIDGARVFRMLASMLAK